MIAIRCLVRSLAVPIPDEAVASEQMLEARNADSNPLPAQKLMELSISGGVAKQPPQTANACHHGFIAEHCSFRLIRFLSGTTFLSDEPFVITAGADAEDSTPLRQRHAVELGIRKGLTNEGVPHLRPVVQRYAANFFKSAHS